MNLTTHNIVSPRNAHAYAFHLPFLSYRQLLTANHDWRRIAALSTLLAAMVTASLLAGTPPPAQAADICPNAVQRAQNHSSDLPDCRAYEMVSPPYKEGFGVDPRNFTDDGIVSYISSGNFAGSAIGLAANLYHATRSATGWSTTAPTPSGAIYDTNRNTVAAESADLRSSLWVMHRRDRPGTTTGYYLRTGDGNFTEVGQDSGGVAGTSADLSHLIINHGFAGNGAITALYEYVGTGNDGPPRAVSVDNLGNPTPAETCPKTTSIDGRVIVFASGCHVGLQQLWARVGGTATIAVSGSECTRTASDVAGACNGPSSPDYAGSAADGSRVYLITNQQLINADHDESSDLYACDIPSGAPAPVGSANPCATLTQVSGGATGAQVENVVAVSNDGSRVYFVAHGVLADNLGIDDHGAVAGGHNLYLWQRDATYPTGHTSFIAGLDTNDLDRAQMSPDGRYLTFVTASALVTAGQAIDTDSARDVYRYDSDTNAVVRVSTSISGGDGNDSTFGADVGGTGQRSAWMTSDGSSIAFDTAESLSPSDTDGVKDVYVWHDGHVSLISSGGGNLLWISPSGRDIFFSTDVALVAADGDIISDLYDARAGGGFDVTQMAPCSGTDCQSQLSVVPDLIGPPTLGPTERNRPTVQPALSLRAVNGEQRKRLAATGKLKLTVTANTPGTIRARATATLGGRLVTVAAARHVLTAPGQLGMSLTLSKKARAQLVARGRLEVKVAVSHSKVALNRSMTLTLVYAKPKQKTPNGSSHARRAAASSDRIQP
jgi:hypothetical protein